MKSWGAAADIKTDCAAPDTVILREFLVASNPTWSAKEILAVTSKLAKVRIHFPKDLVPYVWDSDGMELNQKLKQEGQKGFKEETLLAMRRELNQHVQKQVRLPRVSATPTAASTLLSTSQSAVSLPCAQLGGELTSTKLSTDASICSSHACQGMDSNSPSSVNYFVVGTMNDCQPVRMCKNGNDFICRIVVGSNGWDSFQILCEEQSDCVIYPSSPDAHPKVYHEVCGPNSQGQGKQWTIGRPPNFKSSAYAGTSADAETARSGDIYEIRFCTVAKSVSWELVLSSSNEVFTDEPTAELASRLCASAVSTEPKIHGTVMPQIIVAPAENQIIQASIAATSEPTEAIQHSCGAPEKKPSFKSCGTPDGEVVRPPDGDRFIHTDVDGSPRGSCQQCGQCSSWVCGRRNKIRWHGHRGSSDEDPKTPQVQEMEGVCCEGCGCTAGHHKNLYSWFVDVRRCLKRFRNTGVNTKRKVPRRSGLPASSLEWNPAEVALFVLSQGVFDPRIQGSWSPAEQFRIQPHKQLVSVITPTSESRRPFHPLLYTCFCRQEYEPKELVVVESGDSPSQFLLERALEDRRVVYRFFKVHDAREDNLEDCVVGGDPLRGGIRPPIVPGPPRMPRGRQTLKVPRGGQVREGWSLGMKRNIACQLAHGQIIAHFDDDDIYAPCYLDCMCNKLMEVLRGKSPGPSGGLAPAAATLAEWHTLDLSDQTFGFFEPKKEPLLQAEMRDSYAYGYGFSYIYTRAAWEIEAFADVEWSEDGCFTSNLLNKGHPVRLVYRPRSGAAAEGLAAHSHHPDSTSGGEVTDIVCTDRSGRQSGKSVRMGLAVATPEPFKELLPILKEIVSTMNFAKGVVHPVRKQLHTLIEGTSLVAEVGLNDKGKFMSEYAAEIARWQVPQPAWGRGGWFPGGRGHRQYQGIPRSPHQIGHGRGHGLGMHRPTTTRLQQQRFRGMLERRL